MSDLSSVEQIFLWIVVAVAGSALIYAIWLWRETVGYETGNEKMQEVWKAIQKGAQGYLGRQLKTILLVLVPLTVILFLSVYVVPPSSEAVARFGSNAVIVVAIGRTIAFIIGAAFSTLVGQLGMRVAIESNIRVTAQAVKENYNKALTVAYRGGTFTGMLTDGLGLLGGTVIFMLFGKAAPDALLGFGFGGTLVALFMRIGEEFIPNRLMSARIWSEKWKKVFPKTIRETPESLPTWSGIMWATAPEWRLIFLNLTK